MEVSLSTETQNLLFWLLMQDKLSTIEILRRRITVLEDYGCAVCRTGLEETVEHLFLKCPIAIQCWASLNLNSPINLEHLQILEVFRTRLQVPFFMEVIILMCYQSIWGSLNALIFDSEAQNHSRCTREFQIPFFFGYSQDRVKALSGHALPDFSSLPSAQVWHSAKNTRRNFSRQSWLCRVSFLGHSAKSLPSAQNALGKKK